MRVTIHAATLSNLPYMDFACKFLLCSSTALSLISQNSVMGPLERGNNQDTKFEKDVVFLMVDSPEPAEPKSVANHGDARCGAQCERVNAERSER